MTARSPDWKVIEADYRTGIKSLRAIGKEHGITEAAIRKRAKRDLWSRDLDARIQQKADEMVRKQAVVREPSSQLKPADETTIIEANADLVYQVRMRHRKELSQLTEIKDKLLDHVETAVRNLPDLQQVIQMQRQEGDNGLDRANDALKKAVERSTLIEELKKLVEIDERVRKGEYLAFNIPIGGTMQEASGTQKKRVLIEFVDATTA